MLDRPFNQNSNRVASLEDVRRLAYHLHQGQQDHLRKDYILHPERVVNNVNRFFPQASEQVIMAAWLHDTMKNCKIDRKPVDEEYLRQQNIPEEVITMVRLLTKPEDDDREYDEVIDDLVKSGNEGAMMVKIADNGDTLHPVRIDALRRSQMEKENPGKAQRLHDRYVASIEKLSNTLGIQVDKIFTTIQNPPPLEQKFKL